MRRVDSLENDMRGVITYDLGGNRYITVSARDVHEIGLEEILKAHGVDIPTERVPVFQSGREIGSVHGTFDPAAIKPTTFLYDVRPGDFKRTDEGWEAARNLGPGDLEAVPGFVWKGDRHG